MNPACDVTAHSLSSKGKEEWEVSVPSDLSFSGADQTNIHVDASILLGRIVLYQNQTLFEYHWPLILMETQ